MAKPILLITRRLPPEVEGRATTEFDARLTASDTPVLDVLTRAGGADGPPHAHPIRPPRGERSQQFLHLWPACSLMRVSMLAPGRYGPMAANVTIFASGGWVLVGLWASVPVGLLATALLEANNLRDVTGDERSGKRTLAVRVGARHARWLYVGSLALAALGVVAVGARRPRALVALAGVGLGVRPGRAVVGGAEGRGTLPVLGATGRLRVAVGVLLALGVLL